jgi:hypothetical protein
MTWLRAQPPNLFANLFDVIASNPRLSAFIAADFVRSSVVDL